MSDGNLPGGRFDRYEALSRRGRKMKTSPIILGCLIVGGIVGFSATQSDIDFITSDWIYGPIVGSFLLSGLGDELSTRRVDDRDQRTQRPHHLTRAREQRAMRSVIVIAVPLTPG